MKIGGSVITDKSNISSIRKNEIDRISKEIASFREDANDELILVHGAGSFGHPQAKKFIEKGFDLYSICLIHNSTKELNSIFIESLNNAGVEAISINPLSNCILENNKIASFQITDIPLIINKGMVPVFYGDIAMDRTLGASILSGDKIITYLGSVMKCSRIGAGCNVDGVFDNNGSIIKKISPLNFIDFRKDIQNGNSIESSGTYGTDIDVTGRMLGKVTEFIELAKIGIDSRIFNATKKGMVSKFLYGEDVGTLIGI